MLFADIIIDISVKSLDRPFQYRVPDPLQAGAWVGALVVSFIWISRRTGITALIASFIVPP